MEQQRVGVRLSSSPPPALDRVAEHNDPPLGVRDEAELSALATSPTEIRVARSFPCQGRGVQAADQIEHRDDDASSAVAPRAAEHESAQEEPWKCERR
jgi:hypothetical protein